jgi:hypothetical protein
MGPFEAVSHASGRYAKKLCAGLFGAEIKMLIMPSNPLPVNRLFCIGPIFARDCINKSFISNRLREKKLPANAVSFQIRRRTSFREVCLTATPEALVLEVFLRCCESFKIFLESERFYAEIV